MVPVFRVRGTRAVEDRPVTAVPPNTSQQPYPPAVGPTAPSGSGGSAGWMWAAGAAAAVGLVAVVTSSGGAAATPVEAVQAHVDAYVDEDWIGAYEHLCAEEQGNYDDAASYAESTEHYYGGALRGVTVGEAVKDGDEFEVEVVLHTVFGPDDKTIDVVSEDGSFRVCEDILG